MKNRQREKEEVQPGERRVGEGGERERREREGVEGVGGESGRIIHVKQRAK